MANFPVSSPAIPSVTALEYNDNLAGMGQRALANRHSGEIQAIADFLGYTGAHNVPVKLGESVLAANASFISFTSIPSGYRSLRVSWIARTNAASSCAIFGRLNNDSGTNYDQQVGSAAGASAGAFSGTAQNGFYLGEMTRTASAANEFAYGFLEIMGYGATSFYKMVLGRNTRDLETYMTAGEWKSTAAVTRVDLVPTVGGSAFIPGSIFTLEGRPA